jgi:hypothetical protein
MPWTADRFDKLSIRSQALHGNKYVLPIGVAALELRGPTITAREAVEAVGGKAPANRTLQALERLCAIGAMEEQPHLGRPTPRVFRLRPHPYWDLAVALAGVSDSAPSPVPARDPASGA